MKGHKKTLKFGDQLHCFCYNLQLLLFYLVCVICIFIVINNNEESGKKESC